MGLCLIRVLVAQEHTYSVKLDCRTVTSCSGLLFEVFLTVKVHLQQKQNARVLWMDFTKYRVKGKTRIIKLILVFIWMELEYWVKVKKPERIKSILVFIWMGLYLVKVLAIQEHTYSVKIRGRQVGPS